MKGIDGYAVGTASISVILALQFFSVKCQISAELITRQQENTSSSSFTLEDGDQIALEVSNQLLPPKDLSEKISQEIKLIKLKYRVVSKITHKRKWVPGQLLSTRITPEQIRQVNQSDFGPLEDVTTIDLLPFYIVTILSFGKPYNPIVLSEMLSFHYGFSSSPNTVYFDGDDIYYDMSNSTYIFKKGPEEDCMSFKATGSKLASVLGSSSEESVDCSDNKKHFWEFVVSDEGNVRLVKEYSIDLDGIKSVNQRYQNLQDLGVL